jgi:hypothetical protein
MEHENENANNLIIQILQQENNQKNNLTEMNN